MAISDLMPHKSDYRYFSRQVFKNPNQMEFHRQRIRLAMNFSESEPLQGALADMFYGCWYDMPFHAESIFEEVKSRLRSDVIVGFEACIKKDRYVGRVSTLATRWSVLVMPSMDVALHRLKVSSDDARLVAKQVSQALLNAREREDTEFIERTEQDFFAHCMACDDSLAFSLVWFGLAKQNWVFDKRWNKCRVHLEAQNPKL